MIFKAKTYLDAIVDMETRLRGVLDFQGWEPLVSDEGGTCGYNQGLDKNSCRDRCQACSQKEAPQS